MMERFDAAAQDTPLARLTAFLARYPEVRYLRLVHTAYSGLQQCKMITVQRARELAAQTNTLRPGDEVLSGKEGEVEVISGRPDARGVVTGNPTHISCVLVVPDDTGTLNPLGIESGELTTQIDWTTLSPILPQPTYGFVSCSLYHTQDMRALGYGYDRDPRVALRRVLENAKEKHGMEVTTGVELEFTLFDEKDLSQPLYEPRTALYANQHATKGAQILEEIVDALEHANVPVWAFHPETGSMGLMEVSLSPADAATTADQVVFVQHIIRNVATKHGCFAALAAAPVQAGITAGRHIHMSFSRPEQDMHFIAGLLRHMPALMLVLQASIDGYGVRQREGGPFALWATNKCGPINLRETGRMEIRIPDAHFSIHLQIAAIVAAGMDGVAKQLMPKQKESPDWDDLFKYAFLAKPDTILQAELAKKMGLDIALPKDLGEAIEKFKEDRDFWVEALGEKVADGILLVQEGKWKKRLEMTKEERRIKIIERFS